VGGCVCVCVCVGVGVCVCVCVGVCVCVLTTQFTQRRLYTCCSICLVLGAWALPLACARTFECVTISCMGSLTANLPGCTHPDVYMSYCLSVCGEEGGGNGGRASPSQQSM
jgi:hypothetical protein